MNTYWTHAENLIKKTSWKPWTSEVRPLTDPFEHSRSFQKDCLNIAWKLAWKLPETAWNSAWKHSEYCLITAWKLPENQPQYCLKRAKKRPENCLPYADQFRKISENPRQGFLQLLDREMNKIKKRIYFWTLRHSSFLLPPVMEWKKVHFGPP